MKIVKCLKCDKLIHSAKKCLFCGNSTEFENIETPYQIHENAIDEYQKLGILILKGKLTEVITVSDYVLKWMPMCSSVFWFRVLAKNHCKTDVELVQKGFKFMDSSDFNNAERFGDINEKQVYGAIKHSINMAQIALKQAVVQHEYEEKQNSAIYHCQEELSEQIDVVRKSLFKLWSDLEQVEHAIHLKRQDLELLIHEHKVAFKSINHDATDLKNNICKMEECTEEEFQEYLIRLNCVLNMAQIAKKDFENITKNNPLLQELNDLLIKQNRLIQQVATELSNLKLCESRAQTVALQIEEIERKHQTVLHSVENFDFRNACSLFGLSKYMEILNSSGAVTVTEIPNIVYNQSAPVINTFGNKEDEDTYDYMLNMYGEDE